MTDLQHITALEFAKDFIEFIQASPTSYHAATWEKEKLLQSGYREQKEQQSWKGYPRGFVHRSGALIAWQLPAQITQNSGFRIVGAHNDSPSFKIKPNPDTARNGFSQVNVEIYGGPMRNSWLNRDLGIAGQISTLDGEIKLVRTAPIMFIPQLAPHLDHSQDTELKLLPQDDYHPIWAIGEEQILECLAESAGVEKNKIAGMDLYAYDTAPAQIFGGLYGTDFIAAGRQDNLSSIFAGFHAFLEAGETSDAKTQNRNAVRFAKVTDGATGENDILVFAAFDHEEVGSNTFSGADSVFTEQILRRISYALVRQTGNSGSGEANMFGEELFLQLLANSTCISADAGHSINPNKTQKHDPAHQVVLGGGPLLKINSQQRYATESRGIALWKHASAAANVPVQEFVSNNNVTCGSTIGPAVAARLGILTADVGIPLLSMHSVREIGAPADLLALAKALRAYYVLSRQPVI